MRNFYVQIIEHGTNKIVKESGPMTERRAEKLEGGLNISLAHDRYYTATVQKPEPSAMQETAE